MRGRSIFLHESLYFVLSVFSSLPISAKDANPSVDNNVIYVTDSVQPRWWPGDPNPQPGTQEWLWTHASYTTTSSAKAKKCGLQALAGATISGGVAAAVDRWLFKLAFSVGAFAADFTINFAYSITPV